MANVPFSKNMNIYKNFFDNYLAGFIASFLLIFDINTFTIATDVILKFIGVCTGIGNLYFLCIKIADKITKKKST